MHHVLPVHTMTISMPPAVHLVQQRLTAGKLEQCTREIVTVRNLYYQETVSQIFWSCVQEVFCYGEKFILPAEMHSDIIEAVGQTDRYGEIVMLPTEANS